MNDIKRKNKKVKTHSLLYLLICPFLITNISSCTNEILDLLVNYPVAVSANATFYLDSENGDDSNDGTSPENAWRSLNKANTAAYQSGNQILLKRGCIWKGQLAPMGSGTVSSPIILGAYGEGNKPILDGEGQVKAVVYLRNQSNWIIRDLELTNYASERGDTYRSGILVENENGGRTSNVKILNNYVRDISGSFRYVGSSHPHQYGGIAVNVIGTTGSDKWDDVLIEGNFVERAGRTGIVVWDAGFASESEASTNVIIRGNTVKDIDSDGILAFGCSGALLEHNTANGCGSYREDNQFNGAAAIWCTRSYSSIIQYNEAYNTKALEGNADGMGFDLDMQNIDCIVQYNYSHDNEGGFMLLVDDGGTSSGNIIRYNISQNDKERIFMLAGHMTKSSQIYNNTIYIKEGLDTKIFDYIFWSGVVDINTPWEFKNNIVYNLGTGGYNIPGTGGIFEGNVYYGNHPVSEPVEPGKITSNPQLMNPGSGGIGLGTLDGYKLQNSSPIAGAGVIVGNNGRKDFWSNVVSGTQNPTIGAYELNIFEPSTEILFIDNIEGLEKMFARSTNIVMDWAPGNHNGDPSVVTRSNSEIGYITYECINIKNFEVTAYVYAPAAISPSMITVIGSENSTFNTSIDIPVNYTNTGSVGGEWTWNYYKLTPVGTIPANINYLKVQIAEGPAIDGHNWALSIGKVTITYDPGISTSL
jgi:parallel beta-helix repeat protein